MTSLKEVEILKEMFPYMQDYDTIMMSIVNSTYGNEIIGLGVRLDGWKKNDPNAYWMESIATHRGIFQVAEVPQVIKYYQLIAQRRDNKIETLLN